MKIKGRGEKEEEEKKDMKYLRPGRPVGHNQDPAPVTVRPGSASIGYLTLDAAAQYASVSPRTVKRWIARGLAVYQGTPRGKILVRPGDIDQYLEKRTAPRLDLDVMAHEVMRGLAK